MKRQVVKPVAKPVTKQTLLQNLQNDTYCRIGVSRIHGVGVIAIRDIPKGTDPFRVSGRVCSGSVRISRGDVQKLPPVVRKLVQDFIAPEPDGSYYVPEGGLNSLNISFYMNHSDRNNMDVADGGADDFVRFITNRRIRKGEELFINYTDLDS